MKNKKITIDYLANHKDYLVCQHQDMYHFNTDTCLLGEFIKINKNEKVLDVGTNNGALLVYIIHKGGLATGLDLNAKALKICHKTLKINQMKAKLLHQDFKKYNSHHYYDVIVSNPPFFTFNNENEQNKNANINMARHESFLPLDDLCFSLANNLKEDGRIYLVYKAFRFKELEEKLHKNNLYINKYQFVYDKSKKDAKSVLLEISFKDFQEQLIDIYIN